MNVINDAKVLKYSVLERVARLAFAGELAQRRDDIPYDMIQGSVARYRCCVYKEREIIRERVRAASGQMRIEEGVLGVLPAACEGCPINRYMVTENCQKCLTKRCVAACAFGAITITGRGAYIEQDKCRECGKCVTACPYNAISDTLRPCVRACPVDAIDMDESKLAVIRYDRCIDCGACANGCPFGAITENSEMVPVIEALQGERPVIAMVAPAIEGQFGAASLGMLAEAIRQLGFADVAEVALGADAVSLHEAEELRQRLADGKRMTTSCCPAFYTLIRKHYPKLRDVITKSVSPMTATARYVRKVKPDALTVFIGPCIAKKHEAKRVPDSADFVLTFEELRAMCIAKDIDPETCEGNMQQASAFGRGYASSGGVARAVHAALVDGGEPVDVAVCHGNGAAECKKALLLLSAGRLPEQLLEGMACEGGCVAGPACVAELRDAVKQRQQLLKQADGRSAADAINACDFSGVPLEDAWHA